MVWSKKKRIILEAAILGSLTLAFAGILLFQHLSPKQSGLIAHVYLRKEEQKQFDLGALDEQGEYYTLHVSDEDELKIHAKKDAIAVVYSSCPGQDCVHQGYISKTHEAIICAHLGVYISLSGGVSNIVEVA